MLRWARRATLEPAAASEADLRVLRDTGLDDCAILDAVLVVAYFSFVNRIALLLGVQVEQGFEATCGPLPHA
jgi:alkylhydroperoxidase family enzyme